MLWSQWSEKCSCWWHFEKLIGLRVNAEAKPYVLNAPHPAARNGYERAVGVLREHRVSIDVETKTDRTTAIQLAFMVWYLQLVKLLLEKSAHTIAKDHYGFTALFQTALNGYPKIIWLLLKNNANIEGISLIGNASQAVLHWVTMSGNDKITQVLLNHTAVYDGKDSYGSTPLILTSM